MPIRFALYACAFIVCALSVTAQPAQVLQYLSRYTQQPPSYDKSAAEVVTYDPVTKTAIYCDANSNKITFVNITNPSAPVFVRDIFLSAYGGKVNSVATKNGIVAVALEDAISKVNPGKILFFNTAGVFQSLVTGGALPDMCAFTPDGTKLIVCNEGEPTDNYTFDPEGTVSIINITNVTTPVVTTISFSSLNGKQDSLRAMGFRIYGTNATVAQDFEPEYAAITPDNKTAYITLQENNGLAIIDLQTNTLTRVVALGYKDYSKGLPQAKSYPWTTRPDLGTTAGGQTIKLGGFSGLWFEGFGADANKLRFLTHPDRGPNGEPVTLRGAPRRPFALPNLQLEVVRFELDKVTGVYTILNRIPLKRTDGITPITGRPNLQAAGQGIAFTDEFPVDLMGNDLTNDAFGGDIEGISVDAAGTWWIVDEYRPAIYNFTNTGTLIARYIPQGTAASVGAAVGTYGTETLPAVYGQRRSNRGFEACAIEGDTLYSFIQSPIDNPDDPTDAASKASQWCRIVAFNVVTKTVIGEYLYPMWEKFGSADKIGDAVSLGNGKFYVVERDDATGLRARKYVFEIDIKRATNILTTPPVLPPGRTVESLNYAELATYGIKPVTKRKSIYLPGVGYSAVDKVEGIARIDANTFAVINDNDFGVGGAVLPVPPNGTITIDNTKIPILGLITFDRPNGLDPSDRDNAAGTGPMININQWPVFGMYQPDAITAVTIGGQNYLLTANEGDARDWGTFVEEARVGAATVILDPAFAAAWPLLKTNQQLGRLNITTAMGDLDGDGDFDELYTLGGRGFTIWNADGNLIWDSGNEFETRTAGFYPANFNASNTSNSLDDRSDNKGPEPEAVTTGLINDSTFAFVGSERIGHTFMYNITNVLAPKYVDYINSRNFAVTPNLANVTNGTVGDLGCEVLYYVSNVESPNNTDLLLAANETSGTLSVYQIRVPRINTIPAAVINHCIGDQLTLTVVATGPMLTYQWTKNGIDIPGATSATYTTPVVDYTPAGLYATRVTAAGGQTITTRATQVNVHKRTFIRTQPAILTQVDNDVTVTLKVVATDSAGETYQWYKAGAPLVNNAKYQGVTTNTLTIKFLQYADTSGRYYVIVTGGCSAVQSINAQVYIPRVIATLQPRDTTVCPGDTVILRAQGIPTGGDRAVGYRWRYPMGAYLVEGGRFSGTSSPTLRINGAREEDSRTFVVEMTGVPSNTPTFTREVKVFVSERPLLLSDLPITANGAPLSFCSGSQVALGVNAIGIGLLYQWFLNGEPLPSATLNSYGAKFSGRYKVRISTECTNNSVMSREVEIVERVEPRIYFQPADMTVREGQNFRLEFTLSEGSTPLTYQWYKDGQIMTGITNAAYEVDAAEPGDAGAYFVSISNECETVNTRVATVRVIRNIEVSVEEDAVKVDLLKAGHVRVRITDLRGATVAILHDAYVTDSFVLNLTATTLPSSGTYFIHVDQGKSSIVKAVVLTK